MKVIAITQLADNYAYLIIDESTQGAGIVDCAEAASVLKTVQREGLALTAILPTHHHYDHVGGHEELLKAKPDLIVYGVDERIPGLTDRVQDGSTVQIGDLTARVLLIPAHTSGHIAYYFEREKAVFTGDTLFSGGCGRLFEGDAAMMIKSLSKLRVLPDETQVYFGHEYTETNLRFALSLEPNNAALREKYDWVVKQSKRRQPTTPTTISSEKETNPFFRWESAELRATLQKKYPDLPMDDVSVFAKTRALKDVF